MNPLDAICDTEAERHVLGALMLDGAECIDDVRAILPNTNSFSDLRHQLIYRAILLLAQSGLPMDYLSVRQQLQALPGERRGSFFDALDEAGGAPYLMQISSDAFSTASAAHHSRKLAELAIRRGMVRLGDRIAALAQEPGTSSEELLAVIERELAELTYSGAANTTTLRQIVDPAIERIKAKSFGETDGIPTGYLELDRAGGGFHAGDLIILAARPSMGKTAFALNLAFNAARRGVPVGIFSLEMGAESLAFRALSLMTGFNSLAIRNKALSRANLERLYEEAARQSDLPIHFSFALSPSIDDVRRTARRMVTNHGCGLLILDYLQYVKAPKAERNDLAVGMVSHGLKDIAKQVGVPMVALSQLSRSVDSRENKRPLLSDLRESGQIEQDADEVLFLYREAAYKPDDADPNAAELIAAKRRNGPTGTVHFRFDRTSGQFSEAAITETGHEPDPF